MDNLEGLFKDEDDGEWALTAKGRELGKQLWNVADEVFGLGELRDGIKAKFAAKDWILVQDNDSLQICDVATGKIITELDDSLLSRVQDGNGNPLDIDEGLYLLLAIQFMAVRDGDDNVYSPERLQIKEWIKTLQISEDVIDGSHVKKFLRDNDIDAKP